MIQIKREPRSFVLCILLHPPFRDFQRAFPAQPTAWGDEFQPLNARCVGRSSRFLINYCWCVEYKYPRFHLGDDNWQCILAFPRCPTSSRYTGLMAEAIAGCFRALKTPSKELADVMPELRSLRVVQSILRDHLASLHFDGNLGRLSAFEVLPTCNAVLSDVLVIFEGIQKRKLTSVIAAAATCGQKLLTAKNRIGRLQVLLTLALLSDHPYALLATVVPLWDLLHLKSIACLAT